MGRYSSAGMHKSGLGAIDEFKYLVREAHRRGIEVIMDVVFNHTAEGNENGPMFSFRGVDNSVFYMLAPKEGGRKPWNSINFVCAHDGFTLADLVTYNDKHNMANGEDNKDGENHNNSWNCGQCLSVLLIFGYGGRVCKYLGEEIEEKANAKFLPLSNDFPIARCLMSSKMRSKDVVQFGFLIPSMTMRASDSTWTAGTPNSFIHFSASLTPSASAIFAWKYPFKFSSKAAKKWPSELRRMKPRPDVLRWRSFAASTLSFMWSGGGLIHLFQQVVRSKQMETVSMESRFFPSHSAISKLGSREIEERWDKKDESSTDFFRFCCHMTKFRHEAESLGLDDFPTAERLQWHGHTPGMPDWSESSRFVAFTLVDKVKGEIYIAFNASHLPVTVTLPERGGYRWEPLVDTGKKTPFDFLGDDVPEKKTALKQYAHFLDANMYPMLSYSSIILLLCPDEMIDNS
nr:isoamylase [Ipomoea trifida]